MGAESERASEGNDPGGRMAPSWRRRFMRLGSSRRTIFVASFLESTIVPIPIEVVLVPLMVSERQRLWWIATMAWLGCLAGAGFGYIIGYALFESIGRPFIEMLGYTAALDEATARIRENGFWFIISIGIAPIPFQAATVGAGLVGYSLALFVLASALARAVRYFGLAGLVQIFGERTMDLVRRHRRSAAIVGLVIGIVIVLLTVYG